MIDVLMEWLANGGWKWVPGWYLLMSVVTYVFYAADKAAARHGEWRTKESTLHLLELLGGWPGALLAQKKLHHKNRKTSYQFVFFVVLLINVGILSYAGYRSFVEVGRDRNSARSVDVNRGSVSIRVAQ